MTTTNITKARSQLFDLAERVVKFNDTINVTTKDGSFVMISEDDYNSLMETLYLYSIPGMKESIEEGINTPLEDCEEVDWESELQ
ncbi:MAG: type II toxin-antitoxin system Phd/YefM family antitoxin [Clostridia bacterium]|nr:type II toxin-antitoxin system Phd/YefM family antitoxin [Clostridia bacterium]